MSIEKLLPWLTKMIKSPISKWIFSAGEFFEILLIEIGFVQLISNPKFSLKSNLINFRFFMNPYNFTYSSSSFFNRFVKVKGVVPSFLNFFDSLELFEEAELKLFSTSKN